MASLHLSGIHKNYGATAVLKGIDLSIADGEFIVFVGPSGCGKSTLLRVIAGLEMPSAGSITIDKQDVTSTPASERGLAMVFQSYALYPHMSVRDNMAFALENVGMARAEIDQRVARASSMLRLDDYLDRKPGALSGGQRQRVAIGRAIVREPKIFLFDEPLSNLDAELRVATRKELAELHQSIGGTMIYVTHDQIEAMTLADRIVVLNQGWIEQIGTPLELYNRPANLFVAGFIGSPRMNLIETTIGPSLDVMIGDTRLSLGCPPALDQGDAVILGVRPEHIQTCTPGDADFHVTVGLVEQLGGETYLYASGPAHAKFTLRVDGQSTIQNGATIPVRLMREHVHVFNAAGVACRHAA